MQVITTTQLRTKSKELVKELKEGRPVDLIHRLKVVRQIKPVYDAKPLTAEGFKRIQEAAKKLNLPRLSYKKRDMIHRKHLMEKYGKGLS